MPADSNFFFSQKAMRWEGWILSVLPAPLLVMGAVMSFLMPPDVEKNMQAMGWSANVAPIIGILTGYLGGAVATPLRVGETGMCFVPVAFGIVFWLGLYLRDARIRELLPFRKST